jgi:hypothetical protein
MGTREKPPAKTGRAKARRSGLKSLGAHVPAITRAALGRKGFAEAGLLDHWREIVGEDLARLAQPVKLAFPRAKRTGGTLTLRCGGAAALEIQHLAPLILERINAHLGYGALTHLRIEQGASSPARPRALFLPPATNAEKAEVTQRLKGIGEPALREQLERLGILIRRRSKLGN